MDTQIKNPAVAADDGLLDEEPLGERFLDWARTELIWYAGSFTVHLLGLSILLLIPMSSTRGDAGDDMKFSAEQMQEKAQDEPVPEPGTFDKIDAGQIETEPPKTLNVDPTLEPPGQKAEKEKYFDNNSVFREGSEKGGETKEAVAGSAIGAIGIGGGPKPIGPPSGTWGVPDGHGTEQGDFHIRGQGWRKAHLGNGGGNVHTERAVTMALIWLANHQLSDGSWSLKGYTQRCVDGGKSCTGPGGVQADAGATAMALLPFLAAAQTHKTGHYKNHVKAGLSWLIVHQDADGNLAKGCQQPMYSHGLATIALCEAYGMTGDSRVGVAAQKAVNYILAAQNKADGGWRYNPGDAGDTSVVGWQLMALKSAHMAGLLGGGSSTGPAFNGTSKWLDSVAVHDGTEYGYQPGNGSSPTMTSVGLLCRQYLGAQRDNPMLTGGMKYLLDRLPDEQMPNIYYWYYATQVMHNMGGSDWDTWNRKMRELLVHSQCRDNSSCAFGSWTPGANDTWASHGGRVMSTALSCLTLEIYYRYLPLFNADGGSRAAAGLDRPVANAKYDEVMK